MKSNIEPGCKAIALSGPVNMGRMVKVGNFIGELSDFEKKDLWEVDREMSFTCGGVEIFYKLYPGQLLQRIDDHDEPEENKINEYLEVEA